MSTVRALVKIWSQSLASQSQRLRPTSNRRRISNVLVCFEYEFHAFIFAYGIETSPKARDVEGAKRLFSTGCASIQSCCGGRRVFARSTKGLAVSAPESLRLSCFLIWLFMCPCRTQLQSGLLQPVPKLRSAFAVPERFYTYTDRFYSSFKMAHKASYSAESLRR